MDSIMSSNSNESTAAALTMSNGLSRPLNPAEIEALAQLDRLKHFLATAPSRWSSPSQHQAANHHQQHHNLHGHGSSLSPLPTAHPALNRFLLPSGEYVSCVLWSGLYHITGTDIVRALVFRFEAFGRPVVNMKKFEEGVFSDLRNLKPGTDACLEEPKSPFLDLLFKYQCIRTQKKQKVFYWFSVPHDRLFLDALERDLKREKMGLEPTTVPKGEPGLSFKWDPKRTLYEQYLKPNTSDKSNGLDEDEEDELQSPTAPTFNSRGKNLSVVSPADIMARRLQASLKQEDHDFNHSLTSNPTQPLSNSATQAGISAKQTFLNMFSLFEGSPTYKQRRKKATSNAKHANANVNASAAEASRRRSVLASGMVARRDSMMETSTTAPASASGMHPSLASSFHHQQQQQQRPEQGSTSRPQSQHSGPQPLPSYGLSMNPTVERPNSSQSQDDYSQSRPMSQHQSSAMQIQSQGPAPSQEMTRAFICPLYSCGALFRRPEELKKHLPMHGMSAILRSRSESTATNPEMNGSGLKFPCDRPGCHKVFTRADNLRLHQQACNGGNSWPNGSMMGLNTANLSGEEHDELEGDNMDLEADIQEIEVPANSRFEDDLPSSGSVSPPPDSSHSHAQAQSGSQYYVNSTMAAQQQQTFGRPESQQSRTRPHGLAPIGTPKFAVTTSAETSPYVETPDAGGQWAPIPRPLHQVQHQHALNHQMSHHNLGTIQSPPGSAHSNTSHATGRSVFGAQQLLPGRYQSPEFNLYGYHPSSAPSHKATFDQSTLYPPSYQHPSQHHPGSMVGLSLRRHRSAAPTVGSTSGSLLQHHQHRPEHADSRPASSAGESNYDYGNVIVNPPASQFAYSVDNVDGRRLSYVPPSSAGASTGMHAGMAGGPASDHSSPLSYGQVTMGPNGEYTDSPYDGSGGSPGSAGHGHGMPLPGQVPVSAPMSVSMPLPPQVPLPMSDPRLFGMRGHAHSLSSEIATQQMQQYVNLDALASDEYSAQQASSNGHEQSSSGHEDGMHAPAGYMHQTTSSVYRAAHADTGAQEEMYQYPYQHASGMHIPHQYGYNAPVEQQVAL